MTDNVELNQARTMSDPNISIFLDVTRFSLPLTVAIGHWTQPAFQDGWKNQMGAAIAAVGGFFILSGFTIRMVTSKNVASFRLSKYAIDRLSRLWSVVLPALLLTCLLDFISYRINPTFYWNNWGIYGNEPLYRIIINASFGAQLWDLDVTPLSNNPFWSISYEAWFYLLFGLFMARRPAYLLIAAIVAGPSILFLMVLWLIGVATYDLLERASDAGTMRSSVILGVSATLSVMLLYLLLERTNEVREAYNFVQSRYLSVVTKKHGATEFMFIVPTLVFVPVFGSFLCAIRLIGRTWRAPKRLTSIVRGIGNFTFPLYLCHFPLFVVCGALGFYDRHSTV